MQQSIVICTWPARQPLKQEAEILRDWLLAPGSLSRRLARLGERFSVQVLRQRVAPFRAQERAAGVERNTDRHPLEIERVVLRDHPGHDGCADAGPGPLVGVFDEAGEECHRAARGVEGEMHIHV